MIYTKQAKAIIDAMMALRGITEHTFGCDPFKSDDPFSESYHLYSKTLIDDPLAEIDLTFFLMFKQTLIQEIAAFK